MHVNVHSRNVLPANNNSLVHDNSASKLLKHENDRLMELLISQDLVHTAFNSLAAINDYKNIQQSFVDEYNEILVLNAELAKKHDIIEKELLVYVSATCPSLKHLSDKLVVVTPINGIRKTRVSSSTEASEIKPRSNIKKDRISQASSRNKKKNKVEDQTRISKSSLNNMNRVSKTVCNTNVKHSVLNVNSKLICTTCHECMFDAIHDLCISDYLNDVNARVKSKSVKSRSGKSKRRKCGNLLIARMMGYGDYQLGNVTISRVYYVEGIEHNLFSMGQFYDSDLEVAFQKHTCYVWNLEGADLLSGSRDINLYTISLDDMLKSSPICLLSKAFKTKSWFWPKSKNVKVRVNTEESAVKPEPELKNTVGCNLNPSDGPGKPNSIFMKTVKTKWALNQLQQPICVQLTKTVKTLKAQS
ncbi:hypothetical protein Tco_1096245 [Tanacetum coccineum]